MTPVEKLLGLCIDLWRDFQKGAIDFETLNLELYTRKFEVGKFPKNLIAPILLKRTEPTEDDATSLRVEINRYCYSKRKPSKEERENSMLEEQTAIALLKQKGYRVMKKTIAYIDI